MAGTPKAGRVTGLELETIPLAVTPAYTRLGGAQDCELKITRNTIEVTDKDSAGWDEFISGNANAAISGTCTYEEDDAGQALFVTSILAGTVLSYRFRPWGSVATADEWVCDGFATSATISSPNKDALSFPFSIQLTGAPVRSDQT